MYRITNGFDKLSLGDFNQLLNDVSTGMTGNAHFPDQQTAVTAFNADKDDYIYLAQKARTGGKVDMLLRDAKRSQLIADLRKLGNAVTYVADGDLAILKSSGLPISKSRQASADLVTPAAPTVRAGVNKGELVCIAKKQIKNEQVSYMISSDPGTDSSWEKDTSTKKKYLFTGLTAGLRYYIKYALCGVRDQEVTSEIVSYIPQ